MSKTQLTPGFSMPPDGELLPTTSASMMVAAGSAMMGLTGQPVEVILGAAGFAALQPIFEAGWRRFSVVLGRAAFWRSEPPEELIQELRGTPEKEELLLETITASRHANTEERLRALANSLAIGAGCDSPSAELTVELMIVRAIADLDTPHLFLLKQIATGPPDDVRAMTAGGWTITVLQSRYVDLSDVVAALLVGLERHGLVDSMVSGLSAMSSSLHDRVWIMTAQGNRLLQRLNEASESGDSSLGG